MRAHEIIRGVLDLIDQIESPDEGNEADVIIAPVEEPSAEQYYDDETRRFKQIVDLLTGNKESGMYDNSPVELVAGIDSVTIDAGGGDQVPKHPADIRADSVSMYPGYQNKMGR